jgi:gamma-glutamyltranspeptidase / glutathione hydrolase
LERFDVSAMEPWGAKFLHVLAEVTKACWQDRERYLGDPDAVKIPVAEMLSDRRAAEIAGAVTDRASSPPQPSGTSTGGEHTVNVVTADRDGGVVSLTATQGEMFGSDVVIQGLGLVLGHGMSRFDRLPAGNPNAPAPGKRMHHNMSPLVILRDGRPRFVVGMPGGQKIPNVTAQIALNLMDFGHSPAEALRSTKLHTNGAEPLQISRADDKVVDALQRMGHTVKRVAGIGGPANAMSIEAGTGQPTAASEAGKDGIGGA